MQAILFRQFLIILLIMSGSGQLYAERASGRSVFQGQWIINHELSDDTDRQVEVAIKKAGGRIQSGGRKGKGRYRGGPPEQALYDHISYDEVLQLHYSEPEFRLVYEEDFERVFYTDNRKRVVSASGSTAGDGQDFSFASWSGNKLIVESRPRDGGWIHETYQLENDNQQLRIKLELKPSSFSEPINIIRIYNRKPANVKY